MENKKFTQHKEVKFNLMGSEVVEGYACKPKKLEKNKAIMHFKTHIFICNDERCGAAHKNDEKAAHLREILKDINLARGAKRIKISRTGCFGACRFRSVANIFENTRANGNLKNNNLWLKNIHKYSDEQWKKLFFALAANEEINEENFPFVPISDPKTYS